MCVSPSKDIYFVIPTYDQISELVQLDVRSDELFAQADKLKENPDSREYKECKKELRLVLDKIKEIVGG